MSMTQISSIIKEAVTTELIKKLFLKYNPRANNHTVIEQNQNTVKYGAVNNIAIKFVNPKIKNNKDNNLNLFSDIIF